MSENGRKDVSEDEAEGEEKGKGMMQHQRKQRPVELVEERMLTIG